MTHNGYTNYETWSVALIIDNDQGLQDECRALVKKHPGEVRKVLKDWVENSYYDLLDKAGEEGFALLLRQLATSGLQEVDWYDIARHFQNEGESEKEEP
jgi:hypothetical protein